MRGKAEKSTQILILENNMRGKAEKCTQILILESNMKGKAEKGTQILLLFPMLKYCILIGCSLPPKSDIMQDDVNCPISLS